jgi:hypothetical protein
MDRGIRGVDTQYQRCSEVPSIMSHKLCAVFWQFNF